MTTTVTVTVTVYDFPAPLMYLNTAYYPMDESSGNNREDSHTGGLDLSESGGNVGTNTGLVYGTVAEWTDDDIQLQRDPPGALDLSGDWSIGFWIYINSLPTIGNYQQIMYTGQNVWAPGYLFRVAYNNAIALAVYPAHPDTATIVHASTLSLNTWHFIQAYHDNGAEIGIRRDTQAWDTDAHTTGCPADASAFVVGKAQGDNPDFRLGPVMLWGRVLTAAEWTWLYNTGSGRTYAAIAAYTGD